MTYGTLPLSYSFLDKLSDKTRLENINNISINSKNYGSDRRSLKNRIEIL